MTFSQAQFWREYQKLPHANLWQLRRRLEADLERRGSLYKIEENKLIALRLILGNEEEQS